MNVATTDHNWKILKWHHHKNFYKYKCQITESMYYVVCYDDDDETLIYSANWLSLRDATRDYNRIKTREDFE